MGCCFTCFRKNDDAINGVGQSDILTTSGVSNMSVEEPAAQDVCNHKSQKKNEQENGMQATGNFIQ